ncbi:hypothetical protein NKH18_42960 [Streptomyces sp. M10(2022)]
MEEFIHGRELHLDGVVRDGKLQFFTVARYLVNVIAIRAGGATGSVLLRPEFHPLCTSVPRRCWTVPWRRWATRTASSTWRCSTRATGWCSASAGPHLRRADP